MSQAVPSIDVPTNDASDSFEAALAAVAGLSGRAPSMPAPQPFTPPPAQFDTPPPSPEPALVEATPAPASSEPAAPPPPSAKELERIAALDAREAKLRETEARLQAERQAREAEAKTAREQSDRQWASFRRNPVAHVRSMRPDLTPAEAAEVAESLYVYALGDKAPPDVRQRQAVAQETTEVRSEVDQLRAEIEELRAARAREADEAERARYRSELRDGAAKAANVPIVAGLLQRSPDRAAQMLFEVARRAAVEAHARGETPVVMTAEQAASALEKLLAAQRDEIYGPTSAPAQAPNTQAAPLSPTLTNRDASVRPGLALTDPEDDKELRRAALKAIGREDLWWE